MPSGRLMLRHLSEASSQRYCSLKSILTSQMLDNSFRDKPFQEEFSLLALWRVLVVRKHTIRLTVAATLGLALLFSLWATPKYESEAHLEINPENTAAIEVSSSPEAMPEADYAVTIATHAAVLESDTLALQVIQQLDLEHAEKSRSWLPFLGRSDDSLPLEQSPERRARALKTFHKKLSVRVQGGTRILQIHYLDSDPARSAAVVNTLVADYLEQYFQTRYSATHQASDWLSRQLADLKSDVETSQQRLVDYQKQTGILGESETNNVVMAKLEEINKQLSAAEANRIVKQAVWQLAKTGDPELISSVAGTSFVQGVGGGQNATQLGLLPTLRTQEAQLKSDIAQTSVRLGPNFPKLQQMRSQLGELDRSIDLEISKIAARAENDYISAKSAEDMERALFEKQKQEANQLNDSAIQYGILKRDVDASRNLYEGLQGKLKQAGVLAGLRSSNIVVVDPARPADKPSSPNHWLNLILALTAGTLLGIAAALLQDSVDNTIHTPTDVQKAAGLQSIGIIPKSSPDTTEALEGFRALRTSLLRSNPDRPPKVILVSSALAQEGKTSVSVNLARSLALPSRPALLVDANLKNPSVHVQLPHVSPEPGLSSALLASEDLIAPIQDLGNGFHVLPAGSLSSNALELLDSARMTALVNSWRHAFSYIIIDTPPALSFADALMLSRDADAVLMVVRADVTSSDALLRACEAFRQSNAPILGAVLNNMNFHSARYAHYFGHSYRAERPVEL